MESLLYIGSAIGILSVVLVIYRYFKNKEDKNNDDLLI